MLTEKGCRQRRQLLWSRIPAEIEWLLVGDVRHVQYLSNFRVNPMSFSADQKALLLLTREGRSTLLTDNFTKRSASEPYFADDEISVPWYTHRKSITGRDQALCQALAEASNIWKGRVGLIEPEGLSEMMAAMVAEDAAWQFSEDDDAEPLTLGDVLRSLRRRKHTDEVDLLKLCMKAGEAGHKKALEFVRPGVSEFDIFLTVQQAAQQAAGKPCIVYGDFRATHPKLPKVGGLPTDYVLQDGDLFILDFSVIIHGYRCDFTNTIAAGSPSARAAGQFNACLEALQTTESLLRPGVPCKDLWKSASRVLEARGFGTLAHHAGHGLGMEHPEPPILGAESSDKLIAGDVITLEPGCYIEGCGGIRLEHNYLITDSGAERLSNHRLAMN